MTCDCEDCTQCPYDYCVDENKDNFDSEKIKLREYNYHYYQTHKDIINSQARQRYRNKIANGICVRCSNKATVGKYCKKHRRK